MIPITLNVRWCNEIQCPRLGKCLGQLISVLDGPSWCTSGCFIAPRLYLSYTVKYLRKKLRKQNKNNDKVKN